MMLGSTSATPSVNAICLPMAIIHHLVCSARTMRLLLVTQSMLTADPKHDSSDPSQGLTWGVGRVVRLEHPGLHTLSVELSRGGQVATTSRVFATLASACYQGDAEMKCKAVMFTTRLRRGCHAVSGRVGIIAGAYLITGGLGGLGLRAAALLATVTSLMLTSRSGRIVRDGQGLEAQLLSLQHPTSSSPFVASSDCSESPEVAAPLACIGSTSGVLHLASGFGASLLTATSVANFLSISPPKSYGASFFRLSNQSRPQEVLVFYSSMSATANHSVVCRGTVAYASAATYIDVLATATRQVSGMSALSIQMANVAEQGSGALVADALIKQLGWVRISIEQYERVVASFLSLTPQVCTGPCAAVLQSSDKVCNAQGRTQWPTPMQLPAA
jgi:hypothetical protein